MKNIISNILGVIMIGSAIYGLIMMELEISSFAALVAVGSSFFYFENKTIKGFIKSVITKYISNEI